MEKEMEHQPTSLPALCWTALSIVSAFFANINWAGMQPAVSFLGSIIACGSGLMAIRYYYFATKNKK